MPKKRASLIIFLFAAVFTACGTPPTPDEAARAINDAELQTQGIHMLLLGDSGTTLVSPPKPESGPSRARQFPMRPASVDALDCDRVNRKTFDCRVTWHVGSDTATSTARFRFVHGDDTRWSAASLEP